MEGCLRENSFFWAILASGEVADLAIEAPARATYLAAQHAQETPSLRVLRVKRIHLGFLFTSKDSLLRLVRVGRSFRLPSFVTSSRVKAAKKASMLRKITAP